MALRYCPLVLLLRANARLTVKFTRSNRFISYSHRYIPGMNRAVFQKYSGFRFAFCPFSSYPSHSVIKLPNLSPTMETGTVVSWSKNEGDEVSEGDLLAEIETDKATMSFEASESGYLAKILAPSGTKDIPVGTALCILVEDTESIGAFNDYVPEPSISPTKSKADDEKPVDKSTTSASQTLVTPKSVSASPPASPITTSIVNDRNSERIFASPLARRLAAEQGLDLTKVGRGSGIDGMICSADLVSVQKAVPVTSGQFTDFAIEAARSSIAQQLLESKRTVPHFYLTMDIEVDELLKMRDNVNAHLAKIYTENQPAQISLNDILIKAVSLTCLKVPECNSSWQNEFIRQYNTVNVNVAVATPGGLLAPVIFSAETKGLLQISQEVSSLMMKVKENKIQSQEFQGGTFTISNLGMFGISSFCSIINPPHACALAVGSSMKHLLPTDSGFKKAQLISVTLSCDHRVVDGAVGAVWLQEFKKMVEHPTLMLV